jgi:predicted ester cyclase
VHHVLREGDLVATHSTMTGTHAAPFALGPFAALPPSGMHVSVPHLHVFRYRGARVAEFWHVWDTAALARQLRAGGPA